MKDSRDIIEALTGENMEDMGMIEACEENDSIEKCPECGGSPIIDNGHDRNCRYCGHWW